MRSHSKKLKPVYMVQSMYPCEPEYTDEFEYPLTLRQAKRYVIQNKAVDRITGEQEVKYRIVQRGYKR